MLSKCQALINVNSAGGSPAQWSRCRQRATSPDVTSSPRALAWCEELALCRGPGEDWGWEFDILGSVSWMSFPLLFESFAELYGEGMSGARNKEGLVPCGSVQGSVRIEEMERSMAVLSVMGPPLRETVTSDSDVCPLHGVGRVLPGRTACSIEGGTQTEMTTKHHLLCGQRCWLLLRLGLLGPS